MNFKKIGKVLTCKSVGTGPLSYKKGISQAAVLQRLRNTGVEQCCRLLFRRCPFKISAGPTVILTELYIGLPHSLLTDTGIVPHVEHKYMLLI